MSSAEFGPKKRPSSRKLTVTHDLLRPLDVAEQKDAREIEFTEENAQRHLATLFSQLQAVFVGGKIDLDRLRNVAHW